MPRQYTRKYTLEDIFSNERVKNIPQYNHSKAKLTGYEKKVFISNLKATKNNNLDTKEIVDTIFQMAVLSATKHYKDMNNSVFGSEISISGNLKREHTLTMAVDDIYTSINTNKGMLKMIISNYNILNDAIDLTSKLRNKPKLYLTINSKTQINNMTLFGSKEKGRAYLINQIMENIYFNDDFMPIQEKYNIRNKRLGNTSFYKHYDREKRLWEEKVGIIKR